MKKRNLISIVVAAAFSLSLSAPARAGTYGDTLTKCLVEKTTPADKTVLVKWMFAMMSLHPEVSKLSATTKEVRTQSSKDAARMFEKLLTVTCLDETRTAVKYEGGSIIEQSFNQLGQVAARELFSNQRVAGGMAEFATYIDKKAMEKAFGPGK